MGGGGGPTRDYWWFWGASATSGLGDGIRIAAFPLLIYTITNDPIAIALVTAAQFLPWAFGPIIGAMVDRQDRRHLMVGAQFLRALTVLGFAAVALSDGITPAVVYLTAFLLGMGEVVVDTAIQAAVPQLAQGQTLEAANSRLQSVDILANRVIGPPVGASLFAATAAMPFVVDGITFVLATVCILLIRTPLQEVRTDDTPFVQDIRDGVRHLWNDEVLRSLLGAVLVVNVVVMAVTSVFVILVLDVMMLNVQAYGLFLSAGAAGGIIGGLTAPKLTAWIGRGRLPAILAVVSGVSVTAIGMSPTIPVVVVGAVMLNLGGAVFNVQIASLRQSLTPAPLLGRVSSSYRAIVNAGLPVGALLGGVLTRAAGVVTTFRVAGVVFGLVAVWLAAIGSRISEPGPELSLPWLVDH